MISVLWWASRRSPTACSPTSTGVRDLRSRRDAQALIDLAERHQQADIDEIEEYGPQGIEPFKTFMEQGLANEARHMLEWLRLHRELLLS